MLKADLRLGEILIRKKIITQKLLQQAIKIMANKSDTNNKLHEILVQKFDIDRHLIYCEIAQLYAFKRIDLKTERIDEARLNFIRDIFHNLDDKNRDLLINNKLIPFKFHESGGNILILITPNPTEVKIHKLLEQINIKQFEIAYARIEDIDELISKIIQLKNEFLQLIDESSTDLDEIEIKDEGIDEEALDAEINKSMLTNLIEGALVEAVRQGASDIHIVPKNKNSTEF